MAKISRCPQCGEKVTIPTAIDDDRLVRCPLCDAEFPLAEALSDAEEAPPELVAVEAVPQAPEESQVESEPEAADAPAEDPEVQAAVDAGDSQSEEAGETEEAPDDVSKEAAEAAASINLWDDVSEAPKIDTGTPVDDDAESHAAGIHFGGIVTADEDDEPEGEAAVSGGRKKKKKEKSFAREMVGIILGGVGGVLLAYYGLNFFGGPRFDFAEVYLPGIQHTVKHRPTWWPDWLSFESEPADEPLDIDSELGQLDLPEPQTSAPRPARDGNTARTDAPPAADAVGPPQPPAVPAGFVSLTNPPSFQPDELGQALKAAHDAFGCPRCNSTGKVLENGAEHECPDCQGHPPDGMTPAAYAKFCRLAEVIAFVETAPGGQLGARKTATANLLETVGRKPENVIEIGQLASSLLDQEDRQTSGILLSGTVKAVGEQGDVQTATVKLAGIDRHVTLAARHGTGLTVGDRVLVLGSLVAESPQPEVEHDPAEPLVWLGLCKRFEKQG